MHQLQFATTPSEAFLDHLAADESVVYIEPNRVRTTVLSNPNDTSFNSQWALNAVNALAAWNFLPGKYFSASTLPSSRLKVAVIDTGANCTHPDFINSGGTSAFSSAGGQFSATLGQAIVPTSTPNGLCDWQDDHGHGTHVSGTIAAATSNSTGVAGLAHGAELVIFKVLDGTGSGTDADVAAGIVAAANAGAKVISMSLGGLGYSYSLQDAVNYAWQKDALVVAAAGNSNSNILFFPAAAHHAMGVAATDSSNHKASFSNYGGAVDIAAPGVSILSTYFGGYANLSGTSMATPHVAAVAALVATGTPGLGSAAIAEQIQRTANSTAADGGWGQYLGYGVINAANAVAGGLRSATTGGVVGQLLNSSHFPVSGIVTLNGASAIVDATGLFRFAPVSAGTYTISASTGVGSASQSVTVVAGADSPVTLLLGISAGTFSGVVTLGGVAQQGVVVQAVNGSGVAAEGFTNISGQYSLRVPTGSYSLRASYPGAATATVSGLSISSGGSQTVNISFQQLGKVAGTVLSGGAEVANAEILVSSASFSAGAVTDSNGAYSTLGIPAGTYTVTAHASGFTDPSSQSVAVSNGGTSPAYFVLPTITVTASPAVVSNLGPSQTQQFTASVSGTANQSVSWSITPSVGSITAGGLYTAPASISSPQSVTVKATSVAAPTQSGTATVTVANVLVLTLSPNSVVGGLNANSNQITLDTAAGGGGAVVSLSSSNPSVAAPPSQVTVSAGAAVSPLFTIATFGVAVNTPVTISATYGGVLRSKTLTVRAAALSSLTVSPASVGGGGTSSANKVTLDGPASSAITVALSSSNPAVATAPASVTVAAGQSASPTFAITTMPVGSATPVTITASYSGVNKSGTLTVNPIQVSSITLSPLSVVGGVTGASNKVTLNGPAPAGGAVVTLTSSNPAVAAVPSSVTVAEGQTVSPLFPITTSSVASNTTVTITATFGGISKTGTLTVRTPVLSALSVSPTSVKGGVSATGNKVTLDGPALPGGSAVTVTSSNTAVAQVTSPVTVAAGATFQTFTITTSPVLATTLVTITASYGGVTKTAIFTVKPVAITQLSLSPASVFAGVSSTSNRVLLDAPAPPGGAVILLTSSNPSAAAVPSSIAIPAGDTASASFTITTSAVSSTTTVTITGSYAESIKTSSFTVKLAVLTGVTLSPATTTGGNTTTANRINLDGPAPPGGFMVSLSSSNSAVATVPASAVIPAGATSAAFNITTSAVAANASVTITASGGAVTKTATLTVNP